MHRGAVLPAMGGLPRRVPPSPAMALLVTPPPQIGPTGNASHVGAGGKKHPAQGPAGGATHKCSRCKSRPKSGSGSSLCIRCKLQRDYGSPRGGFAAPRKKVPVMALPITAPQASVSSPAAGTRYEFSQSPAFDTTLGPPQLSATPASPGRNGTPPGAALPTGKDPAPATNSQGQAANAQPLVIRLEVVGDQPRNLQWSTLSDQDDLTETTWPRCMAELERETDEFRAESLNQVVPSSGSSPSHGLLVDPCPANVELPLAIVGATGAGSNGARFGISRLPPILSLPEAPESPSELIHDEAGDPVSAAITACPAGGLSAISTSSNLSSPSGVVVSIPDGEPSSDVCVEPCRNPLPQPVRTMMETDGYANQHQPGTATHQGACQLGLPLPSTRTASVSSADSYDLGMPYETQSDESHDEVDLEVWRGHVRGVIRSYIAYLEEAFSALLKSPSGTKWVTILSVIQKKTVLSKILQRLSALQRALLPPEEHTSLRRVSQSAERLFKAMSQLRGQMVAARGIAQRPGPNPTYSSNSRTVYPSVASDDNANGYTSTSVVAPCPVSLSEQNAHSSGACATQSSSTGVQAPPVDVNAYTYSPAVPQTATANGNSAASFCRPHAGDGLAFNGTTQPDGVPSPVSLTPKSLTEEADEEITKILAKLQKEDRCTAAPPSASGALVSSAPGSILPQQVNSASSYAFMSNSAAMSGQNAPKVDGLAGTPCTTGPPLGEVEPRGQQQTASEDGLPPQLMTGLLSSEFPPQTEAFMGSANSAPTHQAVSGYGPNAAQTREPLSGTYASMTGPETNASSRLFGQQQQLQQNTATSSIGNRQMYSDVSKTLAQGSGQQPWSPQPPQATVKAEVRDVFTPPPSKKGHVESRSGNVIPPVAAPQLRSLLARKLPPPTARAATPNPCFTSNSYAERNGSQPQSPTAPQTSDQIFPFGRHQRVYLTPNQGIISYNDAPKPSKLLPPAHVDFGSSLQQKPLHIQNQQNSNSPQFVPQHQQSHAQLKEMPHPLSPDVQAIGHQQIMSVESPAGLSHPQRLGDADPSASGSGLPHCVALNRLNAFTSGPLDALTGPSELSSSGYSSWTTLQCPAPSAQGVPNTRG